MLKSLISIKWQKNWDNMAKTSDTENLRKIEVCKKSALKKIINNKKLELLKYNLNYKLPKNSAK